MNETKEVRYEVIDLEPTWVELCWSMSRRHNNDVITELLPACKIADIVRQAQKAGKHSVTFTFNDDGTVTAEDK